MFNRSFNHNPTNLADGQSKLPLKKNKFSGVVMVCTTLAITQALLGCSHSKDKIATDDDSKEKTSKTSKTAKADAVDCASPNVANSIQQSVMKQITDQASGNAQQLAKQAGLDSSNMSVADMVTQLSVAVSNVVTVPGQSNQCQASVAITLPDSQINNANQIAKSLNQPPIAERLATKGLTVQNNVISTPTALFNITANGGTYDATPVATSGTGATLLAEISDILANSQIKQMMSKSVPSVAGAANPAIVAGTAATAAAVASHADTSNTLAAQPSSQSNKTSTNTGSSSHSSEPSTHTASQHAAHKAAAPVHHARPAATDDSDDDSDDSDDTPVVHHAKKPVHTVTKTEQTTHVSGDKNVATTTTTHTVSKVPAEHPAPKAASSDEPKLTIEEKNEKY